MTDLNKESTKFWGALKPTIDAEIKEETKGAVQRRRAKVTTAPSLVTNTIGVTEPFGDEMLIPFVSNLSTAKVGDTVWIEFMYGSTNAFASMYADADRKDVTVGGVLDVVQRRTFAMLSSAGWYRVLAFAYTEESVVRGANSLQIDFVINRSYSYTNGETHRITLYMILNNIKFADETSLCNVLGVSNIRYTINTAGDTKYGFVDIYYNLNTSNPIYIDFSVHQASAYLQSLITPESLQLVSASPANETIITDHTFIANGHNFTMPVYMNGTLIHNS